MSQVISVPIFVVGTGRSGSTVFFDLFAKHPDVAWPSQLSRRYPHRPDLNRMLMYARGIAPLDWMLGKHLGPSEAYPFWDFNCPGFSNPCRDLRAEDVTPAAADRLRHTVNGMVTKTRNRFLAKITGWPRIRYLHEIYPEALFVEVTRDPCATASSLLEVPFWDGWRGPPNWRRGPLPPDLDELWRQEGCSFVALAGIEWLIVRRAMDECLRVLPATQLHTVEYSSLCADPIRVFRDVITFCGLTWTPRFERSLRSIQLVNRDDKWRNALTVAQQGVLLRVLNRFQAADNAPHP